MTEHTARTKIRTRSLLSPMSEIDEEGVEMARVSDAHAHAHSCRSSHPFRVGSETETQRYTQSKTRPFSRPQTEGYEELELPEFRIHTNLADDGDTDVELRGDADADVANDTESNDHDRVIKELAERRRENFKRSFRYVNIAILATCIIAALLRPMEEKQRRRETRRSISVTLSEFNTGIGRRRRRSHHAVNGRNNRRTSYVNWKDFFYLGGIGLGNADTDTDAKGESENDREHLNVYANRYLDENEEKDQDNENDEDQHEDEDEGDNDDKDDAANEDDDVVDDAYYNETNATYYEQDDVPYYEPEDDFYVYIGDDNIEEMKVFPLELTDYAGFLCTSLSIILSVGGGIGPGAILVAVYIVVMDFPPKVAIPLSCVTGLGVNTLGNIMNRNKRHPLSNRPVIDWDLVLIMEPVILLGAIMGTYLNKLIEGKIIIVMLVLLLSVIAHNTLKKARRMHHAEELYIKRVMWARQKRMNAQTMTHSPVYPGSFDNKLAEADPPFVPKIHSMSSPGSPGSPSSVGSHRSEDQKKAPLLEGSFANGSGLDRANGTNNEQGNADNRSDSSFNSFNQFIVLRKEDHQSVKSSLIEEEADPLPQNKITYIITMFLVVISANVLKGGVTFESPLGITCGSFGFWLFELITASWLIFCTTLAGRYLLRRNAIKEAVGFDYVRGDIKWDVRTVVIYPSACLLAGIVSGMFGIGVAVFVGPLLVGIGVNPAVASATCGCMNFFTALAATSSYVVLGSIIPDREYAMVLFVIGFCSCYIGIRVIHRAKSSTKIENNKRLERHSYMAYSMGVVVLVSALCMTVEALLDVINHSFDDDQLDGVCVQERIY